MKIKSIVIEGMHNVAAKQYDFDNLNYLYGENGAGKSTVLEAIQLAVLGYIPGYAKTNQAIIKHAGNNTLSVTCNLDNAGQNVKITRTWAEAGKGNVLSGKSIEPEGFPIEDILSDIELPIYNFAEFKGMTSNKLKDWFIQFLPNAQSKISWKDELTGVLGDKKIIDECLLDTTLKSIDQCAGEGVDKVRNVNTLLKDRISYTQGNIQRLQATTSSLVKYDDCDESLDVEQIRQDIERLTSLLSKVAHIEVVRNHNAKINEELSQIHVSGTSVEDDAEYIEIQNKVKVINEKIAQIETEMKTVLDKKAKTDMKAAELVSEMKPKAAITSKGGICPYTEHECESVKEMISQLEEELAEDNRKVKEYSDELNGLAETYQELSREQQEKRILVQSMLTEAEWIKSKYDRISKLQSDIQMEELIDGQEMTSAEIQAELKKLQDTLVQVEANKKFAEMSDKIVAMKFKEENTLEVLKIWDKLTGANGLQSRLMNKPFEDMEQDMTAYLAATFNEKDVKAKFNLTEKANSFNFGLVREGKYIEFEMLSSGEKCLYTLALMMCIMSRAASSLKVIMIDDLLDHLDDENASKLFDALYKIKDIQFILAGVKECNSTCKDKIVINIK